MLTINLPHDGKLNSEDLKYLGGKFNWLELLKLRGVGSSKFIYDSGIEAFDHLKELATATNFVNLEILKGGMVIRFKKQNFYQACLLPYDEIVDISVVSQRVRVIYNGREKIVHQAEVAVRLSATEFKLLLIPSYYPDGIEFLSKKPLKRYCRFEMLSEILEEASLNAGKIFFLLNRLR